MKTNLMKMKKQKRLMREKMTYVDENGVLSESAKSLLHIMDMPLTAAEIAKKLGEPISAVQKCIVEMVSLGLIAGFKKCYIITEKGKKIL